MSETRRSPTRCARSDRGIGLLRKVSSERESVDAAGNVEHLSRAGLLARTGDRTPGPQAGPLRPRRRCWCPIRAPRAISSTSATTPAGCREAGSGPLNAVGLIPLPEGSACAQVAGWEGDLVAADPAWPAGAGRPAVGGGLAAVVAGKRIRAPGRAPPDIGARCGDAPPPAASDAGGHAGGRARPGLGPAAAQDCLRPWRPSCWRRGPPAEARGGQGMFVGVQAAPVGSAVPVAAADHQTAGPARSSGGTCVVGDPGRAWPPRAGRRAARVAYR